MMLKVAGLVAAALLAAASAAQASQLDLAKAGKLQCYQPNTSARHCVALSGYAFPASGAINPAQIMLNAAPLLVMSTVTPVTFKNGDTICGFVRKSDLDSAQFAIDGAPVDAAKTADLRAKVWSLFSSRDGKEICTVYTPNGTGFTATTLLDGKADPQTPPATVLMVGPQDGYSVGP
jgi:hypothetical protein